ncbi:hypothetical protein QCA50_001999 [Cerrena zonata]|uniref:Uncharacterized protein n=1 Tax=Cerrena zonata TaxID=2478898 RepID=A0AAW0GQ21_9APHY
MHDDGPNIPQRTSSMSPPSRTLSPGALQNGRVTSPPLGPGIMDGMSRMGLGQDPRMSPNPPPPGPGFPTRSSSTGGGLGPGSSFNPGQIVPGPGFGPGQVMAPPSFGPGQIMNMQPPPGPSNILPPPRGTSNAYRGPGGPPMGLPSRPAPSPMQHPMQHMPGTRTSNMSDASGSNGPTGSRPPSDGSYASVRKSPSSRSLASQFEQMQANGMPPPMPGYPEDLQPPRLNFLPRTGSSGSLSSLQAPQPRPLLPSAQMNMRAVSTAVSFVEPSPPNSPVEETPRHMGPVTSTISAQMKCKVFLKQQHATWKNLGAAKLKLYRESPTNIKQLVVEADNSKKTALISTIVLEDGVERVGKTGVAIELSDQGQRTGIVYMIQLRNESSAAGLFDSLLAGSDRSEAGRS